MLWIPVTIAAACLQTGRNALQRDLIGPAGLAGATLVRFLFGLPFALALAAAALSFAPGYRPHLEAEFWIACAAGAAAQVAATAALLAAMRRAGFALGTVFQLSGIPLAGLIGLALGDRLSPWRWLGLGLTCAALAVLAWPRRERQAGGALAALMGLAAGLGFAVAANAYRQAALGLGGGHAFVAAQITLVSVQGLQSAVLIAGLAAFDRPALAAVVRSWRASLGAGALATAASSLWFTAFALAPARPVRAVGAIEAPVAAAIGRHRFAERPSVRQLLASAAVLAGVCLAALG
jgi:drug/metabolite transporter (DMT)-like permease